ncbi:hypothetical protein J6590_017020 [Homalodisca vitripennis]|nr:hypothetical protein J6590_017020 [Homalodisca vitripennis]
MACKGGDDVCVIDTCDDVCVIDTCDDVCVIDTCDDVCVIDTCDDHIVSKPGLTCRLLTEATTSSHMNFSGRGCGEITHEAIKQTWQTDRRTHYTLPHLGWVIPSRRTSCRL